MTWLILRRLASGILSLWLVTVLVFVGTQMLPGDVAQIILGQSATPETLAALREQLGLNQPATVRYFTWLFALLRGDFGTSLANGAAIGPIIAQRLFNTFMLTAVTAAIAIPLSIMLGLGAAVFKGTLFDRVTAYVTMVLVAVPEFLLATLLVMFFAVYLKWLPAVSYVTTFTSLSEMARTLALPVFSLTLVLLAQITRMTRSTVINILKTSYIEMAVLKGTRPRRIVFRHAILNAVGPIVNIIALNLAWLISGVVVVETVFTYPGLAKLVIDGVAARDFPVVQACALIFCGAYVVLILLSDIFAILANPRLRRAVY